MRKLIVLIWLASMGLAPTALCGTFYNDTSGSVTIIFWWYFDTSPCTVANDSPGHVVGAGSSYSFTVTSGSHVMCQVASGAGCGSSAVRLNETCGLDYYNGFGPWAPTNSAVAHYGSCTSTNCESLVLVNVDSVPRTFQIQSNNMGIGSFNMQTLETVTLNPGREYQKNICSSDNFQLQACRAPVGNSDGVGVIQQTLGNCDMMYFSHSVAGPTTRDSAQMADNTSTNAFPSPLYNGGSTNIAWGTNGAAATEGTVRSGFSALFDEASKVGATLHDDLQRAGTNTDGKLDADLLAFKAANHFDMTNGPSDSSWTNAMTGTHRTDAATIWADAQSGPVSSAASTLQGLATTAGNAGYAVLGSDVGGGGSGFGWTVHAGDYTFEVGAGSGESWSLLTQCASISRQVLTWIACLGYLLKVAQDIYRVVRMIALTKGASVVPLQFSFAGIGGNVAGVVLYLLIIVAGMALWAIWLGVMLSSVTGGSFDLGGLMGTVSTSPVAGMNAGGLALLCMFVPIGLVFGLALAYLAWRMSVSKMVLLFTAATKALCGW
jgi:hypothetical protein